MYTYDNIKEKILKELNSTKDKDLQEHYLRFYDFILTCKDYDGGRFYKDFFFASVPIMDSSKGFIDFIKKNNLINDKVYDIRPFMRNNTFKDECYLICIDLVDNFATPVFTCKGPIILVNTDVATKILDAIIDAYANSINMDDIWTIVE